MPSFTEMVMLLFFQWYSTWCCFRLLTNKHTSIKIPFFTVSYCCKDFGISLNQLSFSKSNKHWATTLVFLSKTANISFWSSDDCFTWRTSSSINSSPPSDCKLFKREFTSTINVSLAPKSWATESVDLTFWTKFSLCKNKNVMYVCGIQF